MNLRVTCEFTGGWPNQLILPRPSGINESSDYLWIHRWVAYPAYLNRTFILRRLQHISWSSDYLWIPDWVAHSPHLKKFYISADLQITCEFPIGWPTQLILGRLQHISWSSDYLRIPDWVAHSTHLKETSRHQLIFRLPVDSRSGGPFNSS